MRPRSTAQFPAPNGQEIRQRFREAEPRELLVYKVEADPVKHTVFDKLVQILRRCYRAGCSFIKIVVPDERFEEIVRYRLEEVLSRRRSVAVAMGIPMDWLATVSITIESYRPRAEKEGLRSEGHEETRAVEDVKTRFLKWLGESLEKLVEEGLAEDVGDRIYLYGEAVRKHLGKQPSELARELGLEYKVVKSRRLGKSVKALVVQKNMIKSGYSEPSNSYNEHV